MLTNDLKLSAQQSHSQGHLGTLVELALHHWRHDRANGYTKHLDPLRRKWRREFKVLDQLDGGGLHLEQAAVSVSVSRK
jgi:hypothetical protein